MIKAFVPALVIASALAAPTFAFAQDNNGALTRSEVRSQLVQLEKAGYNPSSDRVDYPKNIQAAEARVNADQGNGLWRIDVRHGELGCAACEPEHVGSQLGVLRSLGSVHI
ncbi:DUF4148 domain-containing protein [Candidatus Burkholderia verschuerenii]|uniref:DUF4148 domain-containing protein n=1 Tax=Candidatus Burkholderia verschuerenii TaxID=242163 RepID=UPI000B247DA3